MTLGEGLPTTSTSYLGFGTTLEQGLEMLPEAEELLVKAWTEEDVNYQGKFWKGFFPILRPRPYQKSHPPLVRAYISEASMVEMPKIGRPVLVGIQTVENLRKRFHAYRDTMRTTPSRWWRPGPVLGPGGVVRDEPRKWPPPR